MATLVVRELTATSARDSTRKASKPAGLSQKGDEVTDMLEDSDDCAAADNSARAASQKAAADAAEAVSCSRTTTMMRWIAMHQRAATQMDGNNAGDAAGGSPAKGKRKIAAAVGSDADGQRSDDSRSDRNDAAVSDGGGSDGEGEQDAPEKAAAVASLARGAAAEAHNSGSDADGESDAEVQSPAAAKKPARRTAASSQRSKGKQQPSPGEAAVDEKAMGEDIASEDFEINKDGANSKAASEAAADDSTAAGDEGSAPHAEAASGDGSDGDEEDAAAASEDEEEAAFGGEAAAVHSADKAAEAAAVVPGANATAAGGDVKMADESACRDAATDEASAFAAFRADAGAQQCTGCHLTFACRHVRVLDDTSATPTSTTSFATLLPVLSTLPGHVLVLRLQELSLTSCHVHLQSPQVWRLLARLPQRRNRCRNVWLGSGRRMHCVRRRTGCSRRQRTRLKRRSCTLGASS